MRDFFVSLFLTLAIAAAAAQREEPPRIVIGIEMIAPDRVTAATPTAVIIAARIPDGLSVRSVMLTRLNNAGSAARRITMLDDGRNGDVERGDRVYTAKLSLDEPRAGRVRFQVVLQARPTASPPKPVVTARSDIFEVAVVEPPPATY
jgi:hypothetical protein